MQATQKQFRYLSVQSCLRGSNDLRVGRKVATFQLFFQSGRAKDLSAPLYITFTSEVMGYYRMEQADKLPTETPCTSTSSSYNEASLCVGSQCLFSLVLWPLKDGYLFVLSTINISHRCQIACHSSEEYVVDISTIVFWKFTYIRNRILGTVNMSTRPLKCSSVTGRLILRPISEHVFTSTETLSSGPSSDCTH